MFQNRWVKEGGFYGKEAPIIAWAGLDIATHPKVLLKQIEESEKKLEEITAPYKMKMLELVWNQRWFDNTIWDYKSQWVKILEIMKKLRSGWKLDFEESTYLIKLTESGIIKQWEAEIDPKTKIIHFPFELWPDIIDIFQDITPDSIVKRTLEKALWILENREITNQEWTEALKCCRDESFMLNLALVDSKSESRGTILALKNSIITLRYHELVMRGYRGVTDSLNDHFIAEIWPKCGECGGEIAGSLNFSRHAWSALHTSCIPEYLNRNHINRSHATYLTAVYKAMFPWEEL